MNDLWSAVPLSLFGTGAVKSLAFETIFAAVKARLLMSFISQVAFVALLLTVIQNSRHSEDSTKDTLRVDEIVFYVFAFSRLAAETGQWYREVSEIRHEIQREHRAHQRRQERSGLWQTVGGAVDDGLGQVAGVLSVKVDTEHDAVIKGTARFFRKDPWNIVDLTSSGILIAVFILRMATDQVRARGV